jgi:hypothetical protein
MRRRAIRGRQLLPTTLRSTAERREYMVSFVLVVVLQAGIAIALLVCAAQTYQMWKRGVAYAPGEVGRVVPAVLLAGAVVALAATVRSAGRIRTLARMPVDRDGNE